MKTPCVFQFKVANIDFEEFVATAKCADRDATLTANSYENRKKVTVFILCGKKKHTFEKYRRLTTTRAKSLVPALKADTVYNVHSDLMNKVDPDGKFVPRDYVS